MSPGGPHVSLLLGVVGNVVSTATIIGTLAGILPPFAAFLGVIWYLLQIWESPTIKGLLRRHIRHRIRKRRARREETTDVQLS